MTKKKLCFISGLLFLFCLGTALGGDRIFLPDDVYYHRFASSVSSLEATWINPAGLGQSRVIKAQYIGVVGVGGIREKWGYNMVGDGIGIGYRGIDDSSGQKYDEYIFAFGAGLQRRFYWGLSYRYIKNGPTFYNKRHFWNIGFLIESSRIFSMAALFSNLNRGRIDGERTDIEQLYSFSYKPSGEKIILSIEIALSAGQNLSKADYNYGVDIIPIRGVTLYGYFHDNSSYEIGFRVNLRKYFIGAQPSFDGNGSHSGTPFYVGYNTGRQSSLIR
jgi:hypothetical protein